VQRAPFLLPCVAWWASSHLWARVALRAGRFRLSLDQIGPWQDVTDCALLLQVIWPRSCDSTFWIYPCRTIPGSRADIPGCALVCATESSLAPASTEWKRLCAKHPDLIELGLRLRDVPAHQSMLFYVLPDLLLRGFGHLARYDGGQVRILCARSPDSWEVYRRPGKGRLAEVKRPHHAGYYALSAVYYDAYYSKPEGAHSDQTGLRSGPRTLRRPVSDQPRPLGPSESEKVSDPCRCTCRRFTLPQSLACICHCRCPVASPRDAVDADRARAGEDATARGVCLRTSNGMANGTNPR